MEKKLASKKKAKTQAEHEESATKPGTNCSETSEESSQVKTKKSRKRKMSVEEDIIDGFLMVSYASLEDLEADGPLKPGAILASSSEVPTQTTLMMKKRREGKPMVKGQNIEKIKVSKKVLPRKPKASKAEKVKLKAKKGKEYQLSTATPETHLAIITEEENKPVEMIKNATEKKGIAANSCEIISAEAQMEVKDALSATKDDIAMMTTAVIFGSENMASKGTMVTTKEKSFPQQQQQQQQKREHHLHLPRKPLSDFSISAIQSMRGSSSVPANQETTSSLSTKDPAVASESTNGTKSIATMTVEPKQDKSISPMEFVMRKETGFQYSRFEETKISARLGCLSPTKSSFSSDDTVLRKSIHHQIDLTGTTITGSNDKSRSVVSSIKGREFVQKDSRSCSPPQHTESRPSPSGSLSSNQESTKHQHQHQHIHQHQHSHQHFHPPFGMVPNGVFPPSYYSGMPYAPSGSITPHTHLPKPVPKPGKWCSVHVKIAHFITKKQKEAERVQFNQESFVQSRTGLHAFQAVPSRTTYERDFPYQSSIRPHFSVSPKAMHQAGGYLRGSLSHESERHPFHLHSRHNPYYHPRDSLLSKRSDYEPPFPYESLSHAPGSSYHGLLERDRSSPPHLESIYRRGSDRPPSDIEKHSRLLHHDRGMLNMSIDRETHHESERHRHTSFMNRDKSAYFQPVKVDAQSCLSLPSHGICATNDLTRKPSPRRLSPLSSSFATQKSHLRGELYDRFRQDHLDHRRYYGADSRLLGGENRLFGQESRLFSSDGRLLGAPETRLFDTDKRLPNDDGRILGPDARKGLLPFGHDASSVSHSVVVNNFGRIPSKFTSSS